MIVFSQNDLKICHSCSIAPNSDWTGTADFVINDNDPEKQELIAKIKKFAPYFDYVLNEAGELVDVVKTGEVEEVEPETPEGTDGAEIAQLRAEIAELREKLAATEILLGAEG